MNSADWDERYHTQELVWGAAPNRWVEQELSGLAPGRALDVACGEGRNALWLAGLGWQVTAVDFSAAALEKARTLAAAQHTGSRVAWVQADATSYRPVTGMDVALLCYLQLAAEQRRAAVRAAAASLDPGGTLLVVAHDSANLSRGTGGPQDASVLYTAADLVDDVDGAGLFIERADAVARPVAGAERPAIDVLFRARRAR